VTRTVIASIVVKLLRKLIKKAQIKTSLEDFKTSTIRLVGLYNVRIAINQYLALPRIVIATVEKKLLRK
jgi:hypothetical protein